MIGQMSQNFKSIYSCKKKNGLLGMKYAVDMERKHLWRKPFSIFLQTKNET